MRRRMYWAVGLAALLATLVACGAEDPGGGDHDSGPVDGSSTAVSGERDVAANVGNAVSDEPGGDTTGSSSGLLDRKIIFTASLELEASDVRAAFDRASLIARQAGGFVEQSSLSSRDDGGESREYAAITVRVPVTQYDAVLDSMRGITGANLLREESSSNEVTEEYTDLTSRMRNLERTEEQYLVLLDRANTIDEILTVNDRLDGVRLQIEQIQGRINLLDDLTDLATVSVDISPVAANASPKEGNGHRTFSEVFADAMEWSGETLGRLGAASAYLVVAAMWLVIPALVLVVVLHFGRRRHGAPELPPA